MQQKVSFGRDEWKVARARIEAMPAHLRISFGGLGTFDKERLIEEIDKRTEVGELMVKIFFNYLRTFKEEAMFTK